VKTYTAWLYPEYYAQLSESDLEECRSRGLNVQEIPPLFSELDPLSEKNVAFITEDWQLPDGT
jgi:hypothetical protein